MKASSLFPRMSYNFSYFIFVSRMPTEAEDPEIKETNNEIISVTGDTEKERIGIDEDLLEVETFTQEEVNTYLSVYEGQFIWLIFWFDFINLKLMTDYL